MYRMHSTHLTLDVTCMVSSSGAASGAGSGRAVTLHTTSNVGCLKSVAARSAASRSAAGAMSRQWNGALTLSGTARAPDSLSRSTAAVTPAAVPEITVWPGALRFAIATRSPEPSDA